jgi:hypothetical protein
VTRRGGEGGGGGFNIENVAYQKNGNEKSRLADCVAGLLGDGCGQGAWKRGCDYWWRRRGGRG